LHPAGRDRTADGAGGAARIPGRAWPGGDAGHGLRFRPVPHPPPRQPAHLRHGRADHAGFRHRLRLRGLAAGGRARHDRRAEGTRLSDRGDRARMATARSATLQRRSLYALVAGVVLLLAVYGFWPRAIEVEAGTVLRAPLAVTVREEGRTRVVERYAIAAPVDGQLERILLEPGDAVQAGQALATLRAIASGLLDPARRAGAEAEWQAAQQEREAASAALAAAEAERARSAAELARNRGLAQRGLVAAQAL